jgi:hypothetical protein
MLVILFSWSPKHWSEYGWWNHPFVSLFQVSTSTFEWLVSHGFFPSSSFLDESGLSYTCVGFLSTESKAFMLGPLLSYNGNQNPLAFLVYPLAIIAHLPHDLGTDASSVLLKFTKGIVR